MGPVDDKLTKRNAALTRHAALKQCCRPAARLNSIFPVLAAFTASGMPERSMMIGLTRPWEMRLSGEQMS